MTMYQRDLPIVVLDDWDGVCDTAPAISRLRRDFPVTVHRRKLDAEGLRNAVAEAAILIPFRERSAITAEVLATAPHLRLIAQTGGGAAHVDRAAAAARGIAITLTPGGSSPSVAELVLGLALTFDHRIAEGDRLLRAGDWRSLVGRDLGGQTLGLLGFGTTAQAVASRAMALGMTVRAWSRHLAERGAPDGVAVADSLDDLLAAADVLSVHLPLTPATQGFLDARRIGQMKRGALLINTARGAIVDTGALVAALDAGQLRGACLDVFDPEPLPADHPLRRRADVVLTPHVGWTTADTMHRFLDGCAANIGAFLAGEPTNLLPPPD